MNCGTLSHGEQSTGELWHTIKWYNMFSWVPEVVGAEKELEGKNRLKLFRCGVDYRSADEERPDKNLPAPSITGCWLLYIA